MNRELSQFDKGLVDMIRNCTHEDPIVTLKDKAITISWRQPECSISNKEGRMSIAIMESIKGRLGKRLLHDDYRDGMQCIWIGYDPIEYPMLMKLDMMKVDLSSGNRYCRKLKEVDAIQVDPANIDRLLRFTGGGAIIGDINDGKGIVYTFPDHNGIFRYVSESDYIVREKDGHIYILTQQEFEREFEIK